MEYQQRITAEVESRFGVTPPESRSTHDHAAETKRITEQVNPQTIMQPTQSAAPAAVPSQSQNVSITENEKDQTGIKADKKVKAETIEQAPIKIVTKLKPKATYKKKKPSPYKLPIPFIPAWKPDIKPDISKPQKPLSSIERIQVVLENSDYKVRARAEDIRKHIDSLKSIVNNVDIKNRGKHKHEPRELAWEAIEIALYFERYVLKQDEHAKNFAKIGRILDEIVRIL